MHRPSSRLDPRKRSLANAKPASVHSDTVPSVTSPETITELTSPWLRGASCSATCMLCQIEPLGSSGGVAAAISALVWEAITIV